MIIRSFFISLLFLLSLTTYSQKGTISGTIRDITTGESLIGATVLIGKGVGTVADLDGKFSIEAEYGEYTLTISYVGFNPVIQKITLDRRSLQLKDIRLKTVTLREVEVVADIARERETPVAFTNVLPAKIDEELASQDIPMILNSTPGVYATQQGGGDGDARITIRGFNQRNVAVMIDGIPVNDMENGWVYWSNWFGLDAVTRSIQVQRGLGASKIAIPSVGGTMNILTKGIDNKKGLSVKQEIGSFGFSRTSIDYNSGRQENGWGYTFAGSFKKSDGWADKTFSEGWFYFGKIENMTGKHLVSLTALGAPQKHGQRSFQQAIGTFSREIAVKYMDDKYVDTLAYQDLGVTYNPNWGYIERYIIADNGDTVHANRKVVNETLNYYHKPQFSLKDFWNISDRFHLSNILYMSVGRGGGTGNSGNFPITSDGQVNYQVSYDVNAYSPSNKYGSGEQRSTSLIRSSINNHIWYGFLSTFNYKLNDTISFSGGADFRYYKGEHYRTAYDLLGGDVYFDFDNKNQANMVKRQGDKIDYYYDGLLKWGGLFAQAEYKAGVISAFLNISGAYTGYKRIDYFKKKDIVLPDTIIKEIVGYDDVYYHGIDSVPYYSESPEARYSQNDWKWIPGFTVKGGVNYNLNEYMNVFLNLGYLYKAQPFKNVIDNNNKVFRDIENERIEAIEIGYSYKQSKYAANLNGYITKWENKPVDWGVPVMIDGESYNANVNGIDALHKGIELDFIYKILRNLDVEGLVSIGDWRWASGDTVRVYDDQGQVIYKNYFDAKGIHVGDAAQTQFAASVRYEIVKGLYLKGKTTFFGRHYTDFDPLSLDGSPDATDENGNPRESWKIPDHYLVDFHAGYRFVFNKYRVDLRFSLLNAFDAMYISDAQNNSQYIPGNYNDFDAKSAAVFLGFPRRYNLSLKIII
ncbi:MAG: TonB-dependent receptor [Bacteroidota bacterium]